MLQWATLTVRSHKATYNCNCKMSRSVLQLKSKSFAAAHSVVQLAQMQHALPLRLANWGCHFSTYRGLVSGDMKQWSK